MRGQSVVVGLVFGAAFVISGQAFGVTLRARVVDNDTGQNLAARVYLHDNQGRAYFVRHADSSQRAVSYDKTHWDNPRATEQHTCVSAHPFEAELAAGRYVMTVERGKEYLPASLSFDLSEQTPELKINLQRWIDMPARGWYSGETHLHRSVEDLATIVLAEDLHVAMPLSFWVTQGATSPIRGDKTVADADRAELIQIDRSHVIWPRNTEYEIFSLGERRHTLGAIFVLGHRTAWTQGVPPWGPIGAQAREEGALLDLDKLDWPTSLVLPPATDGTLYEIANNHLWRTEFSLTRWNSEAPGFLQPPRGGTGGNERDWIHYTCGMYYTLLNAGFRLVPTAGTAAGVHPVPAGFSRVYVAMPPNTEFSYERWLAGLAEGRSFVTTGPMLFATVDQQLAGSTLRLAQSGATVQLAGEVHSEHPLAFAEVLINGTPVATMMPRGERTSAGAHRLEFERTLPIHESGWMIVRGFEDRPDGRVRFAHSAPWWLEVPDHALRISREEQEYLVRRIESELIRSGDLVSPEARTELVSAREHYAQLATREPDLHLARPATDDQQLQAWLENMVWHHRFTPNEVQKALHLEPAAYDEAIQRFGIREANRPEAQRGDRVRVLPYPGGRHPRMGFLEGAIDPQRDTKLSVFLPWDPSSYVVVDLPEAIFTNLGLTYLAHTHIPTIWDAQQTKLEPVEWQADSHGTWRSERTLPNGISFGGVATPEEREVRMELWLKNGTPQPLHSMRAQVCVMLKGAVGFHAQSGVNKIVRGAVAAVRDESGERWIVTAWQPVQRAWQNPPVPCIHSDPRLPDCAPGETVRVEGILSFYKGIEIESEMERLERAIQLPASP